MIRDSVDVQHTINTITECVNLEILIDSNDCREGGGGGEREMNIRNDRRMAES